MSVDQNPAETLKANANTYRLLSRLWLREIDTALASEINAEPLNTAYTNAGGELPPTDAAELQALAYDYCQLFIGPRDHLPPFQSVWQVGTFQGAPADSMQEYLDILNLESSEPIVDHLGIQLQAMAVVVDSLATEPDTKNQLTLERMAATFFRDHLAWCRSLTEKTSAKADTNFYKSLADLTGDFLAGESEYWSTRFSAFV